MKPKITRWTPATCGCELFEYTDENGVITPVSYEQAVALHQQIFEQYPNDTKDPTLFPQKPLNVCPEHSTIQEHDRRYEVVMDEGTRVCDVQRELPEGAGHNWFFEGSGENRVLKSIIVGVDAKKKGEIEAVLEKHGQRVEIM